MSFFQNQFGFDLFTKKTSSAEKQAELKTFDIGKKSGVDTYTAANAGGLLAYSYDSMQVPTDEIELIKTYRRISSSAEVDLAISEIQNEAFIFDVTQKRAIEIDFFNDSKISDKLKEKITEEFHNIYNIIDFKNTGADMFMQWYVDGRLFLHKIIDKNKIRDGIQRIDVIDPLKIKKIREYPQPDSNGVYDLSKVREFYSYVNKFEDSNKITNAHFSTGLIINPDAITFVDSGVYDRTKNISLSHMHKAIIPYNNLKLLEDSVIIYRVTRAPERRVFYIDVGSLPKNKAEQYIRDLMNKFKNKLVYDSVTGSIADKKNILSMTEDFWLPRRDGKGTEISTLPAGNLVNELADVEHFRIKLFQSLNVPMNRFSDQAQSFVYGKGVEIYRDEYRFKKFVDKLRNKFSFIFEDLLKTQLIMKNIITSSDWESILHSIQWIYAEDNNFVEFKEAEMMSNRLQTLQQIDPFTGENGYFSKAWVAKNILKLTDEELSEIKKNKVGEKPAASEESE